MKRRITLAVAGIWLVVPASVLVKPVRALDVGFAEVDITPKLDAATPVWIAGYGNGRRAKDVHDPIMARAVVLRDGDRKLALASLDLVGLQYPQVLAIRAKLPGFTYVMVTSTHNHEGPDVIGLWGPTPLSSGVDKQYLALVVERTAEAVRAADAAAIACKAAYGTAEDTAGLLRDARLPTVYDNVLRVLKFTRADDGRLAGILVQWNCHPESIGSKNERLSADFPATTVAKLKQRHRVPVAYFTGAVGGLMTTPGNRYRNRPQPIADDTFEYAEAYGIEVADLADRALAATEPIELAPLVVSAKRVPFPLTNPLYFAAIAAGVLPREGRVANGESQQPQAAQNAKQLDAVTEVAYLRLGELHVACIPGELYPELVYGAYQEPVEKNVDFPDAPLEQPVMKTLPGKKTLLLGLANDEIGYIIPKRQWDYAAPYAYGRNSRQYGEVNSCGPGVAPALMKALTELVSEAAEIEKR